MNWVDLSISLSMPTPLIILVSYLLGSIPFGYLIVRRATGGDVRATGSGGTGATNVTRRAGKKAGVVTLALDAVKGAAAVALAQMTVTTDGAVNWAVAGAGIAVVAGHVFPVWLKFRGGKGVATGLGVFLVLAPLATVLAVCLFVVLVWFTRYVSLGSIVATAAIPVFIFMLAHLNQPGAVTGGGLRPLLTAAGVTSLLIIFMHRANIGRLVRGAENRLR